jgi:hypothetical protein
MRIGGEGVCTVIECTPSKDFRRPQRRKPDLIISEVVDLVCGNSRFVVFSGLARSGEMRSWIGELGGGGLMLRIRWSTPRPSVLGH